MGSEAASNVAATIMRQAVESREAFIANREAYLANEANISPVQTSSRNGGIPKEVNLVVTRDIAVKNDTTQLVYSSGGFFCCGIYLTDTGLKKHLDAHHRPEGVPVEGEVKIANKDLENGSNKLMIDSSAVENALETVEYDTAYVNTKPEELMKLVTNRFNEAQSQIVGSITDVKTEVDTESKKQKNKQKRHFTCQICGREFGNSTQRESKEMVSNHLALCGTNLPKLDTDLSFIKETFKCKIDGCEAFFKSEKRLKYHNSMVHGENPPNLQCPLCYIMFGQDWLEFNRHFNKYHRSDSFEFPCQVCGSQLKGHLDVIKLHYKYHVGSRDYVCAACGSTFYGLEHTPRS